MRQDPDARDACEFDDDTFEMPRIFLREPGWEFGRKQGSTREFCHQMAPGEDSYHRLSDGELFLERDGERLCMPCAERRGMLGHEPRKLRDPIRPVPLEDAESIGYEVLPPPTHH